MAPVVASLLAVQIGFPLVANEVFTQIRGNPNDSWAKVRAGLDATEGVPGADTRRTKDSPNESPQIGQRERLRLAACLGSLLSKRGPSGLLGGYSDWIKRVNRYSFRGAEQE